MSYLDRITLEPGKRGGKPCIRNLRITVYDVLSYLASGMTYEEILCDFPYLEREDILASLEYAAGYKGSDTLELIFKISKYCSSLAEVDPRPADEILGYNESGSFG